MSELPTPSVEPTTTPEADTEGSAPTPEADTEGSAPTPEADTEGSAPTPEADTEGSAPTPEADTEGSAPTPEADTEGSAPTPEAKAAGLINTIRSNATGACLDSSSFGVRGFPCNGLAYQRWNVSQLDFAQFELESHGTWQCLDHNDAYGLRTSECRTLSTNQKWNITNKGGLEIRNRATNKCLDDSALGVRVITCNDTVYQRWSLI
ncbi:ricin-type beta-trefoil lectin domain protein [Rhodococcus sp. WMMA185]|uniref:RICIN domain-containing protein n=1 Tax=Rhodococcus sp. WMMA185 TaxID=679318 RepID=UPI003FA719C5